MDTMEPIDIEASLEAIDDTYRRASIHAGVVVADGHGLRIRIERGHLEIADGLGPYRRIRRFAKATHGISRLVVVGATGTVSLESLAWCRRLGIGVMVLAPEGTCVLASTPRTTDDARLRRTQALAFDQPVRLDLARWLIARKLAGQAGLLRQRFEDAGEASQTITELAEAVAGAETVEEVRQLEASAAALYFGVWTGRPECVAQFATQDRNRTPAHWSRFEGRRSVLASGNSNRKAERPTNALLSYVYALLETEASLACQVVGLDPGLGLVHSDTRNRQSLALDLMEPVRPQADAFVLDLLERRTFRKVDFVESSEGHVRLRSPLTHELAETLPLWAHAVAPVAEHVAHTFGQAMAGKYQSATPLTTQRHRHAQAAVKARKAAARIAATSTTTRQRPSTQATLPLWSCPDCGQPVTNPRHVRCDACIIADARQTPELRGRRGAAIAARKRALRDWEDANPSIEYDPDFFRREILPKLGRIKLADITEAAGCSKAYASTIRSGKWTPHVSTWHAIGGLAGISFELPPVRRTGWLW